MKTSTSWPMPRDPHEQEQRSEVVFWSRFPDVVGLWTALGWEPQPEEVRE